MTQLLILQLYDIVWHLTYDISHLCKKSSQVLTCHLLIAHVQIALGVRITLEHPPQMGHEALAEDLSSVCPDPENYLNLVR